MKRLIIFMIMVVLCVGFTGCTHDDDRIGDFNNSNVAIHENMHSIEE